MRLPIPNDRLVTLTLVGAVLTVGLAIGLAAPSTVGLSDAGHQNAPAVVDGGASTGNALLAPILPSSVVPGDDGATAASHDDDHEESHEAYEDD